MQTFENVLLESEIFFTKCTEEYPLALSVYEKIVQTVENALKQNDSALLLSQLSFMESKDGYLTFQYIGEARQLLRILNIVALEEKYQTISFVNSISDKPSLIAKYKLSLFSLRRILFALSPESVEAAEAFLIQNHISPFAIYILAKEELILPNSLLFENLQKLFRSEWNPAEMQLFQQLISTFTEA